MANVLEYNPEQGYLQSPSVRDVMGEDHLCFFVHRAVEKLDLQEFEAGYSDQGHPAYHPALLLKVSRGAVEMCLRLCACTLTRWA